MVAKYGFSNYENFSTTLKNSNQFKVVEFVMYRDAIVRKVILALLYLSNHQKYGIDHGELNYSE